MKTNFMWNACKRHLKTHHISTSKEYQTITAKIIRKGSDMYVKLSATQWSLLFNIKTIYTLKSKQSIL